MGHCVTGLIPKAESLNMVARAFEGRRALNGSQTERMLDARIVLLAVIATALALTLTCNTALGQQLVADVPGASASNDALLRRWLPLALNGQSEAQYKVGMMNLYGIGGAAKDVELGVDWLRKAAEQGYSEASTELGVFYLGLNEPSSDTRSAADGQRWLERAAEANNARAQLLLGGLYARGRFGVPHDDTAAANWYRRAAEQGRADAQHLLGLMYRDGAGVERDATQAVAWYRKAAAQGNADAQYDLGAAYANGSGVPRNVTVASAWMRISARRGHEMARAQSDRLSRSLGPTEQEQAVQLASQWKEGNGFLGKSESF